MAQARHTAVADWASSAGTNYASVLAGEAAARRDQELTTAGAESLYKNARDSALSTWRGDFADGWAGLLDAQALALTSNSNAANAVWTAYADEIGVARSAVIGLENAAWVGYQQTRDSAEAARDLNLAGADGTFGASWAAAQGTWLDSEGAASHTVALAINAATETFKNAQRDADAALSGADNVAGRDRDLGVNAVNKADTDAAIEREKTRTITHWNTFSTYAPQQGQAEADWSAAIKAASTDFKQALLLAEDAFIRALVSGQLERSLVALYTAHEGQRASQTATYAEDLAQQTANRARHLAWELSQFGVVNVENPPSVTLAMEAERRSTRPSGFFAAVESSLNSITGGLSRRILLSPGFTRLLNAVDGLFAGWAHALTMGLSTRVRTAMWGEAATRNHQGEWFNLGTQIGGVHTMLMMAGNPCAMGAITGGGLRALNGIQLVGGGFNMAENLASGNYLAAAFDGIGMVMNFSAMSRVCFTGEVQILTSRGWVRFDALRKNDDVLSAPEGDSLAAPEYRSVDDVFIGFANIWHLHVMGEVIRTTDEHPFYVWGKGWIEAKHLKPGDLLRCNDGRLVEVEDICDAGYTEAVYNCRVTEHGTYFVGNAAWSCGIWAHNRPCGRIERTQETIRADGLTVRTPRQLGIRAPDVHHVASNKGGWRRVFDDLFSGAGMKLNDRINRIRVPGHVGPHGRYNFAVYDRLESAVRGHARGTAGYRSALRSELGHIRQDLRNPSSTLNGLITTRPTQLEVMLSRPSHFVL